MFPARTTPRPRHRQGFTLIELLMVVAVIAILISILVPAVGGSITRARIAGVATEINQLDAAIAKFKADHNVEPPSSILLYESHSGWSNTDISTINSKAILQQIWPQFNFTLDRDLNNDGNYSTNAIPVTGSECLVIFLGGLYTTSTTAGSPKFAMIGFSNDPTNPLAPFVAGAKRDAPLFEFQPNRLSDVDSDGIPEYLDSLPSQKSPYLYYSSYDGQGYNSAEFLLPANTSVTYGLSTPYAQGINAGDPSWKPSSHQIISPGYDGIRGPLPTSTFANGPYGYGGAYLTSGTAHLPAASSGSPTAAQRIAEADNITNFSNGVLQP